MRVFLSWSGERSKRLADALVELLPEIVHGIKPWMSEQSLELGKNWRVELVRELKETEFGLLCLTRENVTAPWLLFEAGLLASSSSSGRVIPYQLGKLSVGEVPPPLSDFQGVAATKKGTWELVVSLNNALDNRADGERLKRRFDQWWPALHDRIVEISSSISEWSGERTDRSLLEEILRRLPSEKDKSARTGVLQYLESRQLSLEHRATKLASFVEEAERHGADVPEDYRRENEEERTRLRRAAEDYAAIIRKMEALKQLHEHE